MKKRDIVIQVIFILAIVGIALFEGWTIMHPAPVSGYMTVKNFVTSFYTVSQDDYDYYKESLKGVPSTEIPLTNTAYIAITDKFKPYFSNQSFISFTSSRLSYKRVLTAYKGNVLIKVKSITIKENFNNADTQAKTKEYHYEIQLNETNIKTNKVTVVSHASTLTVVNEKNDNSWKILNSDPNRLEH